MGQLFLSHAEQHVGLVLVLVHGLLQHRARGSPLDAGVVPGGHVVGLHHRSPAHQEVELYLVVAGDAGMRRPALLVLRAEVVDDVGLELLLHVQHVVGDSQGTAH